MSEVSGTNFKEALTFRVVKGGSLASCYKFCYTTKLTKPTGKQGTSSGNQQKQQTPETDSQVLQMWEYSNILQSCPMEFLFLWAFHPRLSHSLSNDLVLFWMSLGTTWCWLSNKTESIHQKFPIISWSYQNHLKWSRI